LHIRTLWQQRCSLGADWLVIDDEQIEIDFVITERDTNQRAGPKEPVNRQKLWQDKEKFIVDKTGSWACPDDSHPLFTIMLTKEKPVAVCYYCSKTWIYRDDFGD